MFVKITNGQIDKYPYSVGDLRRDNPSTSFPKRMSDEALAEWGVFPVGYEAAPSFDPATHRVQHSAAPVLKNGSWVLTKTVVALTAEELVERKERLTREAEVQRAAAYKNESDPLFFKWQRGSSTEQEWLDAVAAIKARYPDPA